MGATFFGCYSGEQNCNGPCGRRLEEFPQGERAPGALGRGQRAAPGAPFASLSAGQPGGIAANNQGATRQPCEIVPCSGVAAGATLWWRLHSTVGGALMLNTFGSGVDTVLSVFRRQPTLELLPATMNSIRSTAPAR